MKNTKSKPSVLKRVLSTIKNFKLLVALSLILTVISVALSLYIPILAGYAIDAIEIDKEIYSIELGVLISVLNKALCWEYEKEWRLVLLNESVGKHNPEKYITANNVIEAKSIILGYNFLDNFISELNNGKSVDEAFKLLQAMIAIIKAKNISIYQMSLDEKTFEQNALTQMDGDFLLGFIKEAIQNNDCTLRNRNCLYISFWEELQKSNNQ